MDMIVVVGGPMTKIIGKRLIGMEERRGKECAYSDTHEMVLRFDDGSELTIWEHVEGHVVIEED